MNEMNIGLWMEITKQADNTADFFFFFF